MAWAKSPPCIAAKRLLRRPRTHREASAASNSHGSKSDLGVMERVDISGGIQASLAGRYAIALFELANEQKKLESVGANLAEIGQALADSGEFAELITSPLVGRDEAVRAVAAVAEAMKLDPITANFLGVLARNRRLSQLGA